MPTITLEEAQSRLAEVIDNLPAGEPVVITRDGRPVARLVRELPRGVPVPGRCKGMLVVHAEDDEHLKDFAEYME
jgi:antitoxin (DNA-binding transcriptional repressor) of toxin-antitoxin stability system